MKTCNKCHISKPFDCFTTRPNAYDGFRGHCRACQKLISRAHREKTKGGLIKPRELINNIIRDSEFLDAIEVRVIYKEQEKWTVMDKDIFEKYKDYRFAYFKHGYIWIQTQEGYRKFHRLLMEGKEIDHINGDPLDNRLCNLRSVTHAENMRNVKKRSGTSSKYKGVSWCKLTNTWYCYINVDGKRIKIGRFIDEEEAGRAYDERAKELHGEFAVLNFAA